MELKEHLEALKNAIEPRIEKANAQAVESGKVAEETKNELKNLAENWASELKVTREQFESIATDVKKMKDGVIQSVKPTLTVADLIESNESFKAYQSRSTRETKSIEIKTVGNMSTSNTANGTNVSFIPANYMNGIVPVKREPFNVRSIFSVIPMTSNTYAFQQETGVEGAPTPVAESAAKPQSDNDFVLVEAIARKIAHHKRLSEELLNDVPAMSGFLSTYGVVELMKVEDTQLLAGTGTPPALTGLSIAALSDANFSGTAFADIFAAAASVTHLDCLTAAAGLLAANKHKADTVIMNPADWYVATLSKGSDGQYVFPQMAMSGDTVRWHGMTIHLTTAVAAGTFYVGDSNAAQIAQREGISVKFYDQDQDNAIKNLVTVVIEERLAFPIYYPTAWYTDTFANTVAAIQAAS